MTTIKAQITVINSEDSLVFTLDRKVKVTNEMDEVFEQVTQVLVSRNQITGDWCLFPVVHAKANMTGEVWTVNGKQRTFEGETVNQILGEVGIEETGKSKAKRSAERLRDIVRHFYGKEPRGVIVRGVAQTLKEDFKVPPSAALVMAVKAWDEVAKENENK